MAATAIETEDLHKTYENGGRAVQAVRGISLTVRQGESFGLLGPNGAGKSTTFGMLTTRVRPSSGRMRVAGADPVADPVAVKRRIGAVTQYNTLDRQLTALENLEFRGRFAGLSARAARARGQELLDRFGLGDRSDTMVHHLSGGQAQRVMIARALLTRPSVLFLDEPTSGLDPQTRVNLWDLLREMHAEGQTIVLTTHYLEEAEALCERIAVVDHGTVLASGTQDELKEREGGDSVVTLVHEPGTDLDDLLDPVRAIPGVTRAEARDSTLRVHTSHLEGAVPALLRASLDAGLLVLDVSVRRPSLETVFLALTGREYRE
ncbi:ABC transporter ATP-binding protein [Streptacidiphilus sp. P02-A3a]|uniref:ABC transporter ATP-binding protein n=1 Tax=Streptacidiphilus sp. P02-A3a TaxID=2704468 RepID=UPI0015F875D5|nr:ABC transporter ATP-binding protein [Streptacidiphilus sp. P02-A3a]QMU73245.1 ABC transporter ATP-binding protein [Streptacidiphilus sp. P02-A3a]